MKDLIFIGGAQGVGKSTVIKEVKRISGINIFSTGTFYGQGNKNIHNPGDSIKDYLTNGFYGIIDTHYAGNSPYGLIRGLTRENLLSIASKKTIDLVLMELDFNTLLERRLRDNKRKRNNDVETCRRDIEMNSVYFHEYCKELNIEGLKITNYDINLAIRRILERIKWHQKNKKNNL